MANLGDAFVNIKAQGQNFGPSVDGIVKKGMAGKSGNVPITVSVNDLAAKLDFASLQKSRDELTAKAANIGVGVDDKTAQATLLRLKARIDTLAAAKIDPKVSLQGAAAMQAKILSLDAALDRLGKKSAALDLSKETATGLLGGLGGEGGKQISEKAVSGAGGAGGDAGEGGSLLANPGTIAAGLAALPFAAQAAAGGIVLALGGGLAAMAAYGASKTKSVTDSFDRLKTRAAKDLTDIGVSFVPVLNGLLSGAEGVLNTMTPVFSAASGVIAGPFEAFGRALEKAFGSPVVKQSIAEVAAAFTLLLNAVTPTLGSDVNNIAAGVTKLAQAVGQNPGAFRDFVSDLFKVAGGALTIIASLTTVATWIETHWDWVKWIVTPEISAIEEVVAHFDELRHDIAAHMDEIASNVIDAWNKTWTETIGRVIQGAHDTEDWYNNLRHEISVILDGARADADNIWDSIWNNTIGRIERGFHDTATDFDAGRHNVAAIVGGIRTDLASLWDSIWSNTVSKAARGMSELGAEIKSGWDWVTDHVWDPLASFMTRTLPGYFSDAVGAIGRIWSGIEGAIRNPVAFVINDVIDGLISAFNTVASAIGVGAHIGAVHPFGLAGGGKVPGFGGGDRVPAMLEGGEVVVPKGMVAAGAVDHLKGALPGFQTGGVVPGNATHLGTTASPSGPALGPLSGVLGKSADIVKIAAALATGNSLAATNAFAALIGASGSADGAGGELASILLAMPTTLISDVVRFLTAKYAAKQAAAMSAGVAGGPSGTSAQNQALGQKMAAEFGWTGINWTDLNQLVMDESGWSDTAANPTSDARGIAQNISGWSASYQSGNATQQINWLLAYIKSRYGSPVGALAHENAVHWYGAGGKVPVNSYDAGGYLPTGLSVASNTTGHPEPVGMAGMSAYQANAILAELRAIRLATQQGPAGYATALNASVARGASRGYYS